MGSSCCTLSDSEDTQPLERAEQRQNSSQRQRQPRAQQRPHPLPPTNHIPQNTRPVAMFQPGMGGSLQPGSGAQGEGAEQIKLAQRRRIIEQLPSGLYEDCPKKFCNECAICLVDFESDDEIKSLPCMHLYHKSCIDDWLMRHLFCPSCMEPVDAALVSSFDSFVSV